MISATAIKPPRGTRTDADYLIETAVDVFQVFEALAEENYRFASVVEVLGRMEKYPDLRTAKRRATDPRVWNYNKVLRCLKTLKLLGYAVQTPLGWQLSTKAGHASDKFLAWASQFSKNSAPLPEIKDLT